MRFIQNFKFKAHILYIDNLFNRQAYELIIFLDLYLFIMTASDPPESKDKEKTGTTPAEEAQQGIRRCLLELNSLKYGSSTLILSRFAKSVRRMQKYYVLRTYVVVKTVFIY